MRPAQGADNSSFAVQEIEPDNELAEPDDPESGATPFSLLLQQPPNSFSILCTQVKASILRDLTTIQIQ